MSVPGQFKRDGNPPPTPPDNGGSHSLPSNIVESVAIGGLSSIAGQPAMLANLAYGNSVSANNMSQQNAIASQQALDELNIAVTGANVKKTTAAGPLQARSSVDVLTGNELASEIAGLKASLAAFSSKPVSPVNPKLEPITSGTIYVNLPATFVFSDVEEEDVELIIPFKNKPGT